MNKRFLVVWVVILAFTLCLGGCGEIDVLAEAKANVHDLTSAQYHTLMETTGVTEEDGEESPWEFRGEITNRFTTEPLALTAQREIKVNGEPAPTYLSYTVMEDNDLIRYYYNGATWQKEEVLNQWQLLFSGDSPNVPELYLLAATDLTPELSPETLFTAPALKYTGTIAAQSLETFTRLLENPGTQLPYLGLEPEQIGDLLGEAQDIDITVFIDKASLYPLTYQLDLTAFLNSLLEAAPTDKKIRVETALITVDLSRLNAVDTITVPPGALGAKETN